MSSRCARVLIVILLLALRGFAAPIVLQEPKSPARFSLRGRVIDEQNQPRQGARVFCPVRPTRLGLTVYEVTSAADGTFLMPCRGTGKANLFAYVDGLAPGESWAESDGPEVTITLTKGVSAKGVVRNDLGQVVPGATIVLDLLRYRISHSEGMFPRRSVRRTASGVDGDYQLDDLPAGAAHLCARAPGHSVESITVKGESGSVQVADIRLWCVGFAVGHVVDALTGQPLEGAFVNGEVQTDAAGRFEVTRRRDALGSRRPGVARALVEREGYARTSVELPDAGGDITVASCPSSAGPAAWPRGGR